MAKVGSERVKNIEAKSCLVGGAVRDQLLNIPLKDKDHLVLHTSVDEMLSAGFEQVGKDFPVFLHPHTKEEYALARTERKMGIGYSGFECFTSPEVTIEEDLLRRDLTINAIAQAQDGSIIDPFNGSSDIKAKVLRHVSPAFVEDPLRVLRVARFSARFHHLGFTVAKETLAIMREIAESGELTSLPAERLWQEMSRALTEKHPEVFFEVLRNCGALELLFPEIDVLWGVPNPAQWHPEICSGIHTMMALQQAAKLSSKTTIRFAVLCHDLGKGLTPEKEWPSHRGHEAAGLPILDDLCLRLKVPNEYKKLAARVCEFHLHSHKAFQLKASTLLKLMNALDIWRNSTILEEFIVACKADFLGRLGFEDKEYPQQQFLIDVAKAANTVIAKTYIEKGIKGADIKIAMDQGRIEAIKKVIQHYRITS